MNPIRILVGLGTNSVTTGLARLRGQFRSFREGVNSEFGIGQFLAVGAVTAGFKSLLDSAGQLADLSARFGVGAEGLQRIGNAAAQDGVELEGVAGALNKVVVAQSKARDGDAETTKSLDELGISAAAFINLSPEEAFYAIADGVAASNDPMRAYTATLDLLGKGAGALIPTLQKGGAEIRAIGDDAGVMSERTVALLDEIGDRFGVMFNQAKVAGADFVGWLYNSVKTAGAALGALALSVKEIFGGESLGSAKAFSETFDEIWHPKEDTESKKTKKTFDIENAEKKVEGAKELQSLYDRLDEQKRKSALEVMSAESRINELVKQRAELYAKAGGEADAKKQAEMWLKAGEIEKELMAERERVAKEQERLLEEKERREQELADKKAKEDEAAGKKPEMEAIASSLTKIGGGGVAFLARKDPDVARTAKGVEKTAAATEKAVKKLDEIKNKINESRWNP